MTQDTDPRQVRKARLIVDNGGWPGLRALCATEEEYRRNRRLQDQALERLHGPRPARKHPRVNHYGGQS